MRLRTWLDANGRSPEWLAEKLGVEPNTVRRWITGRHRPRSLDHLSRIADISGGLVTADDVLLDPTPRRTGPGRPVSRCE